MPETAEPVAETGHCALCGQEMVRHGNDAWHPAVVIRASGRPCPPEPADGEDWNAWFASGLRPNRPGLEHFRPGPPPEAPTGTPHTFWADRLAELELAARAATPGPWWDESGIVHAPNGRGGAWHVADLYGGNAPDPAADGRLIEVGANPEAILADVASQRALMALHVPEDGAPIAPGLPHVSWCAECAVHYPCPTTRTMVARWSSHPSYRQEWKP